MSGSSPLTRGARLYGRMRAAPRGIIPAYAESTHARSCKACRCEDHPRLRGEHFTLRQLWASGAGSSPLTRGALTSLPSVICSVRIIPAYAGSTEHACGTHSRTRDHPRLRGEHSARRFL